MESTGRGESTILICLSFRSCIDLQFRIDNSRRFRLRSDHPSEHGIDIALVITRANVFLLMLSYRLLEFRQEISGSFDQITNRVVDTIAKQAALDQTRVHARSRFKILTANVEICFSWIETRRRENERKKKYKGKAD